MNEDVVPVFYRVSPAYWMNRAWSDDMRLLGLYLLTSPHRSLEGLFWCPKHYILGDLQWSAERLGKPFAQLTADGFLKYDEAAEVAFVVKALKYQRLPNPNMRISALRRVQTVPATRLDGLFLASCEEFCEPLAELLRERLPQRFAKPSPFLVLDLSSPNPLADDAPAPPADPPIVTTEDEDDFEAFWDPYPRKERKTEARPRFGKLTKKDQAAAIAAAQYIGAHVRAQGVELQFVPLPTTFIGSKRIFEDWKNGTPASYAQAGKGPSAQKKPQCACGLDLGYDEDGSLCCPDCGRVSAAAS